MSKELLEYHKKFTEHLLIEKLPTIIELDLHKHEAFLKDDVNHTVKFLCESIEGCKLAYTKLGKIVLVVTDYEKETNFNYNLQKIVSETASIASAKMAQLLSITVEHPLVIFSTKVFQLPDASEVLEYLKIVQNKEEGTLFLKRTYCNEEEVIMNVLGHCIFKDGRYYIPQTSCMYNAAESILSFKKEILTVKSVWESNEAPLFSKTSKELLYKISKINEL